ncbi:tetratricopeptide repeat protein [Francisella philomiragia]|uniref:tetratricopeptide repeat protein n=1 Tax=Francisella philomiragia TaxID=28110 RepID=UPI001904B8DF|nr:SEL1-like repeat protein [Francisella philomiragia]MBK2279281.1 sel1 repeat family protein [Francisella philomiragia]MBK2286930.1 sel1 repeat family protein [Francisella philomiragia]MBK2289113.1 sel1 repeat family protein [Francisella philomiragia]MBK2290831.1 sel1 repeat family protein [Francisella philomiragia]
MKTRDKSVILNLFQNLTIKTITATALIGVSTTAFASLSDCLRDGDNKLYNQAIEDCKEYADTNLGAAAIYGGSLAHEGRKADAVPYVKKVIEAYKDNKSLDTLTVSMAYGLLGNIYYFGEAEPKYPKDTAKGIEYITKSAQLGSIYGSDDGTVPKNFSMSYYWYELGKLNGGSSYSRQHPSPVHQNFDGFMKQGPYCIAIGQDNVGQAYYKGIGIAQSDSKAIEWLEKAYATDPNLSVTTLDLAKMYYNTGDKDKAFEYAQKAISQPLAQAYQYLATFYILGTATDKDPVKAAAYMTVAVDLYKNPATDFWDKFEPTCMPNYKGTTDEFNQDYAEKQLADIKLTDEQETEVSKLVDNLKDNLKKAKV